MANLKKLAQEIVNRVTVARTELVRKEARLKTIRAGAFNGRVGRIDGVMADSNNGLMVLVMIYRHNRHSTQSCGQLLNGKPVTRQYWPLDCIEVL